MYVDTDGTTCVTASFVYGGDSVMREYEIKVTQFGNDDPVKGGPPGCLQYFEAEEGTGIVRTFNFGDPMTDLTSKFVCLFLWTPSFEGNQLSLIGFSLMSGAGLDGNAPYQAQELQIKTLANPGIQTNFLPPRPIQS